MFYSIIRGSLQYSGRVRLAVFKLVRLVVDPRASISYDNAKLDYLYIRRQNLSLHHEYTRYARWFHESIIVQTWKCLGNSS